MKDFLKAASTVSALCMSLQANQVGARYLVALAAIGAIVYALHWAQRG